MKILRSLISIVFALALLGLRCAGQFASTYASGVVYVDALHGNDGNNGLSPLTAVQTITRAHFLLPDNSTQPPVGPILPGGTIYVAAGDYPIPEPGYSTEIVISKHGVNIIGAGQYDTRFKIKVSGMHGIRVTGNN